MDTPIDRFASHLQEIANRLQKIREGENGREVSPEVIANYDALTLALESLHTAESELRQQHEHIMDVQQVAALERERYYALFDGAPDAYLVTDLHGTIQEANRAATRLFNIAPAYLTGKPLALYVVAAERRSFRAFLLMLRENISLQSREQEFMLQSRHLPLPIPISATVVSIRDHMERVIGYRWLVRDISQQRHYQEQLQHTNQLLLSLIHASPLGIVAVDREIRVQLWNPAAEELLGWRETEVITGVAPFALLAEVGAVWDELIQQETAIEPHELETDCRHKDGTLIPVRLFLAPLQDSSGSRTGIITLIADLRDEVRHRAELRAIKSRLTATRDIERRRIAQDLHDDVIQQLVGLQFQLVHFRNLMLTPTDRHLEDVQLGMSRMGSDMGAIVRLVRVILSDLRPPGLEAFGLKRALESYKEQAGAMWDKPAPRIDLRLPAEDIEVPIPVATVLLRVAQEAMRNVRRHADAHVIGVRLTYSGEEVTLQVQDDGQGFECPERLSDLAHAGHFGLLGIAEQVESVGGVLQLASQPGHGSTVEVSIPLAENQSAAEAVT